MPPVPRRGHAPDLRVRQDRRRHGWAAWVGLLILSGCAAPPAMDASSTSASDAAPACPPLRTGLPPSAWTTAATLAGPLDETARKLALALNDSVTRREGNGTGGDALPARWTTAKGVLEAAAQGPERAWTYRVVWTWPREDEDASVPVLQGMLDELQPGLFLVESRASGDAHVLVQRFLGSDYTSWVGTWHHEHLEDYKSSTLLLMPLRQYADTPAPFADLVAAAHAFVACRMEREGTSWALPLIQPDLGHARGLLGDDGRLRLYVPFAWLDGSRPPDCPELGLYGIQVDAVTRELVGAQEPQTLRLCTAP